MGEVLAKKKEDANIFSIGLISCGIAVLYAGTAVTFFALRLISAELSFFLIAATAVISFMLAQMHRSQTISVFAIIGGYLPVLSLIVQARTSLYDSRIFIPVSIAYYAVMCVFTLVMSVKNKWRVTMFAGFTFNALALSSLSFFCKEAYSVIGGSAFYATVPVAFAAFSMALYLLTTVVSSIKHRGLDLTQLILSVMNIAFGSVSLFVLTGIFNNGKMFPAAVFVTALLASAAVIAAKMMPDDSRSTGLFTASAIAASFLIVPFAWGAEYLAVAWIAEALAILFTALAAKSKYFERCGFITLSVAAMGFFVCDFLSALISEVVFTEAPFIAYTLLTLGSAALLIFGIVRGDGEQKRYRALKALALINLASYLGSIVGGLYSLYGGGLMRNPLGELMCVIAAAMAAVILFSVFKALRGKMTEIICAAGSLGFVLVTLFAFMNEAYDRIYFISTDPEYYGVTNAPAPEAIQAMNLAFAALVLICVCTAAGLSFRNLHLSFNTPKALTPAVTSAAMIVLLTAGLITQFSLPFSHPLISIIYVALATLWVILGFIKRYGALRKSGLMLSFAALAKLFIIDLFGLALQWRIISFFVFGGLLIGVSFVYQYFTKRLSD